MSQQHEAWHVQGSPPVSGSENRPPGAFVALAFALSVPFWLVGAATRIRLTPDLPLTWLYSSTGDCVVATALFHATSNPARIGPVLDFGPSGYPLDAQRISALLLVGLAVSIVAAWGPARLTRRRVSPG
ncbi:MAG: hypothetical protein KC432_02685 [Thermomicrobiales bacterium]|nr:hypothetical protein [Thermomicrobiales bacterium]